MEVHVSDGRVGLCGLCTHVVVWEGACRVGSCIESPWWHRGGYALAQPSDHVQHFVVVRLKVQMVGMEVVPEIVPVST